MKIILSKTMGFCDGIKLTVKKAKNLLKKSSGTNIYANDLLTHNNNVMNNLLKCGLKYVKDAQSFDENDIILVRAHGISPQEMHKIQCMNCKIVDTTCPHLLAMSKIIKKYSDLLYDIIFIGEKTHPELIGLTGFCEKFDVIKNLDEANNFITNNNKILIVAQSTLNVDIFKETCLFLTKKFPNAIVKDTICSSAKFRQNGILELKNNGADAIIIVGGKHSANTITLTNLSKWLGMPTFHIENYDELSNEKMKNFKNIGVASGASTDIIDVYNVIEFLKSI